MTISVITVIITEWLFAHIVLSGESLVQCGSLVFNKVRSLFLKGR